MKKESLGRREGKKQGGGSKRSALTKQKNKRTANWALSPQAPSFQKVSAEPSIISQGLPAQGWLGPRESCLGGHLSLVGQINPGATSVQSYLPQVGPRPAFRDSTSPFPPHPRIQNK